MSKQIQIKIAEYAKTLTSNPVVIDVIERAAERVENGQQLMYWMEEFAPDNPGDDWLSEEQNPDRTEVFDLTHRLRRETAAGLHLPGEL